MKELEKQLRRYYRSVRACLPCVRRQKKQILSAIKDTVNTYLAERPEVDIDNITRHFGTPEQIAAAYLSTMDMPELLHSLMIRKRIIRIVGAVAAVVIILWAGVVTWAAQREYQDGDGEIIASDPITITDSRYPPRTEKGK